VPWIMNAPGITPGRKDAIVQAPDIMATFLDYAGIEPPEGMDGKSFKSVIEGKSAKHRDVAVSSPAITGGGNANAQPVITDGRWACYPTGKTIEGAAGRAADRAVDGIEKEKFEREYVPLLFDRRNDPGEEKNVIGKHGDVVKNFHAKFIKLLKEWNTKPEYVEPWKK